MSSGQIALNNLEGLSSPVNFVGDRAFRLLPVWFALTTLALILAGTGTVTRYFYPAAATVIAYVLYRRAPVTYVSFTWWLWFLSAFVRRLVDFHSGWTESSPILAAPLLASLICFPTLFANRAVWRRTSSLPFYLALGSVTYGLAIGLLCLPKKYIAPAALGWFAPLIFGFYMYSEYLDKDRAAAYTKAIRRTFTWGALVVGVYGVLQFFWVPPWDVMWMENAPINSMGSPEPLQIRIFSTLNSSGPLGIALFGAVLILTMQRGFISFVATAASYLSVALCQVRAIWLAWALGMTLLFARQKRDFTRIVAGIVIFAAFFAGAMQIDGIRDVVQRRLNSFTDLKNDQSFEDRQSGYAEMVDYALAAPFGTGLGTMEASFNMKTPLGPHDSGLWEVLLSLGWLGGTLYLGAVIYIAWLTVKSGFNRTEFDLVSSSISLGLLSQLFLGSTTLGLTGVLVWSFAGICVASQTPKVTGAATN